MPRRIVLIFYSSVCLMAGVAFYAVVRGYIISPAIQQNFIGHLGSSNLITASFPSFIHALAMMLLSSALGLEGKKSLCAWISLLAGFEFSQRIFSFGTFDYADLFAVMVGAVFGASLVGRPELVLPKLRTVSVIGLFGFGLISSMATSPPPQKRPEYYREKDWYQSGVSPFVTHEPIYMTYADLRKSFAVEGPRPIKKAGKILVFDSMLLVSEPNVGVHVFNNADPAKPEAKYFLNIPGNLDLAAKNGFVYADSFVDLLVFRIDGKYPELLHRIEDTFAWDPYQVAVSNRIVLRFEDIHKERGVIVGYRRIGVQR